MPNFLRGKVWMEGNVWAATYWPRQLVISRSIQAALFHESASGPLYDMREDVLLPCSSRLYNLWACSPARTTRSMLQMILFYAYYRFERDGCNFCVCVMAALRGSLFNTENCGGLGKRCHSSVPGTVGSFKILCSRSGIVLSFLLVSRRVLRFFSFGNSQGSQLLIRDVYQHVMMTEKNSKWIEEYKFRRIVIHQFFCCPGIFVYS